MIRYDPYTDSFIDNPTKETTATINLDAFPKSIIQMNVVEVSDESIEKIADAVVRKLVERKTEPTISKMEQVDEPQTVDLGNGFSITANDCDTCKHRDKPFDDLPCDMCCKAHSGYEPKDEPQTYITEDRDTQILDAWQVHHRSTTSVEDEPQTDCAWK